jgi:signal transduction histidine kinase
MLLPISSEFVELCQLQLQLLTQTLGASMGILYLAEELGSSPEPRLVPIAAAPETLMRNRFAPDAAVAPVSVRFLPEPGGNVATPAGAPATQTVAPSPTQLTHPDQMVLPLIHDEIVLGVLVTERVDRAWLYQERQQVEQIANTLTLAYILDRRAQWVQQHQQLQAHQQDLMDNLLHQFRNPLTALRTFGKLLIKRLRPGDPQRDIATSIVRESDRLQELLLQFEQVMDQTPSEREAGEAQANLALPAAGPLGEARLTLSQYDVRDSLQPLLLSAAALAQDNQLSLHTEFPENLPPVQANAAALREVWSNLLDNALKYTPAGGEIHVRVSATPQQVMVRISDNGPGIPAQDIPHLFERRYRGVQAQTEIPGTGLGLAIARDLMHQMQGDIQVFSPLQPEGWIAQPNEQLPQSGTTCLVSLRVGKVEEDA